VRLGGCRERDWMNDESASVSILCSASTDRSPYVNGPKRPQSIGNQLQPLFGKQTADQLMADYKSVGTMRWLDYPQHVINQMPLIWVV